VQEALSRAQPAFAMPTADIDRHASFSRRSGHQRTNEPAAPASLGAGRVVGKKSLKLWERLWEPKIATLVNVTSMAEH
jgi:hypothetical protein